jgi:hypothetical protein
MQTHSYAQSCTTRPWVDEHRSLRRDRCRNRILGAWEGDKESVSLRVDLVPALRLERVPEQSPIIRQGVRVPVT